MEVKTFQFTQSASQSLSRISRLTGLRDESNILRLALGVLRWVVENQRNGHQILVKRLDGSVGELEYMLGDPDLEDPKSRN